jgi:hypothetical protein
MDIDNYFGQSITLRGGAAFLLDDAGLGNKFGEVKFLLIKVTYPPAFTSYADKFILLTYLEKTYPISELHIWTGQPSNIPGTGIAVSPRGSEYASPYFSLGGVVLHNPHQIDIKVDILIASDSIDDLSTAAVSNSNI